MNTLPGKPRGLTRLARVLGLDRNPLRRATDRAEAWIRIGLFATFLIAAPIAALVVGHSAYHADITMAQGPATSTQHVKPVLFRQVPADADRLRIGQPDRAGIRGQDTDSSARTDEVLAAVITLAAMALVLRVAFRLALMFLSRRRLAAWEAAWHRIGPQWSRKRP